MFICLSASCYNSQELKFSIGFSNFGFEKQIKSDGKGIKPPLNISQISTMESLVEH